MPASIQTASITSQKFICLEDRFLKALFTAKGPVRLEDLCAPIQITPAAALSIAHRIKRAYPEFLELEEGVSSKDCSLNPMALQAHNVQAFLDKGGFTQINEEEYLQYYEKELKKEKLQAFVRAYKATLKREKWAIGITALVSLGIVMATYLYKQKQQNNLLPQS